VTSAESLVAEIVAKKKRVLSAEGKANIVAALKKRWAAKKAAAKRSSRTIADLLATDTEGAYGYDGGRRLCRHRRRTL